MVSGAPASFPVQPENRGLQKYLNWAPEIVRKAEEFINATLPQGAFLGVHLRNGIDWVRACEHVPQSPNLFAAPQCLGYRGERVSVKNFEENNCNFDAWLNCCVVDVVTFVVPNADPS